MDRIRFTQTPQATRVAVVAALAAAAFAAGSAVAGRTAAESTASNVPTSKADAADATDRQCTGSSIFADMPGMTTTFTLGGREPRPVVALFEAVWAGVGVAGAEVRLTVDGVPQFAGSSIPLAARGPTETHGFNFLSNALAPGVHTATIQWRTGLAGQASCAEHRSLVVLHK
jgi:hypothetical protein